MPIRKFSPVDTQRFRKHTPLADTAAAHTQNKTASLDQAAEVSTKAPVTDEMGAAGQTSVQDLAGVEGVNVIDSKNDKQYDGMFVGGDGKVYPDTTPLNQVPPFTPNNGVKAQGTVIHINGIMTDVALQQSDMQALANTGVNVVGIHNATSGMVKDLAQCLGDKLDLELANNTAVRTLGNTLYDSLTKGEPVHIVGHSQGGLVISRALKDVKIRLMAEDGMSDADATKLLGKLTVETFGGAATRYTDGPSFTHHINKYDAVPMLTGLGLNDLNPFGNPGDGAVIHTHQEFGELDEMPSLWDGISNWMARAVDRTVHGPQDIYFKHRFGL